MKKNIIYLVCFAFTFVNSIFSQNEENPDFPCVNDVNTDFGVNENQVPKASNNMLPNDEDGNPDVRFLNGFDWVDGNVGNTGEYSTDGMFFTEGNPYANMLNIKPQSQPADDYYNYLWTGPKFSPENGWELLLVNLGRYPDDVTINESGINKFIPYVVIYNKFTGIIRVFVAYAKNQIPGGAIKGVEIDLEFSFPFLEQNIDYSGILRLSEGMDKALDQETTTTRMTAVAKNPGTEDKWYSADFQIAYDPCTCSYPSRLALKFKFFSETDFRLIGNSLQQNDIDMTAAEELITQDFLGNLEIDNDGNASNGFIIYKNISFVIDDYLNQLDQYEDDLEEWQQDNKRIQRNRAIANGFKEILLLGAGATFAGSTAINVAQASASGIQWATAIFDSAKDVVDGDSLKFTKLNSETKKLIGGTFSFLIDQAFPETQQPQPPSQPSISYSQMSFAGKLTDELKVGAIDFMAPGTFNDPDDYDEINDPLEFHYPIYNEVLGDFALLESPKVKVSYHDASINCSAYDSDVFLWEPSAYGIPPVEEQVDYYQVGVRKVIQLQLEDELKYTFNPVLSIKDLHIEAAFEIKSTVKEGNTNYPVDVFQFGEVDFERYTYVANHSYHDINIESTSFNTDNNEYFYVGEDLIPNGIDFRTFYSPLNSLLSNTYSFGSETQFVFPKDEIISPTDWPHPSWYDDYENSIYNSCESGIAERLIGFNSKHVEIDEIYLNLIVNVTYEGEKSDGSPHEYTYMFTYKIDDIDDSALTPLHPNLPGSAGDITQYPENLYLKDETFDGSPVEGCQLNGDIYTCKAWNDITVEGEFTVVPNYEVKVEAGNELNIIPEAVTPPEMQFSIVPVLDYSKPMPPVKDGYVTTFCNDDNGYKARGASKSLGKMGSESDDEKSFFPTESETEFAFNIYPNPTSGSTTVSITLEEAAQGELFITDINGRRLESAFDNRRLGIGQYEHQLPTQTLSPGIYLVHLFVNGEHHVKRLVKQ